MTSNQGVLEVEGIRFLLAYEHQSDICLVIISEYRFHGVCVCVIFA